MGRTNTNLTLRLTKIYRCGFTGNGYNTSMKKSLAHLPKEKQAELMLVTEKINDIVPQAEMIFLFGSYARGDWVNGPHVQGRGRLTIRKRSDFDIAVITRFGYTARDTALWDKVKAELAKMDLSTLVRIIPRDIEFVNFKLSCGQYFFTEICEQGIILYNSGEVQLSDRKELNPAETKQNAQEYLDETFLSATEFYDAFEYKFKKGQYKNSAFQLHQAVEFASKTILIDRRRRMPTGTSSRYIRRPCRRLLPGISWNIATRDQRRKETLWIVRLRLHWRKIR